jgi:hypothetical protein
MKEEPLYYVEITKPEEPTGRILIIEPSSVA